MGVCWLIHTVRLILGFTILVGTFNPIIERQKHACGRIHIDLCDCDVNDTTNNDQSIKSVPRISEIMLQTNNKTEKRQKRKVIKQRNRKEPHTEIKKSKEFWDFTYLGCPMLFRGFLTYAIFSSQVF